MEFKLSPKAIKHLHENEEESIIIDNSDQSGDDLEIGTSFEEYGRNKKSGIEKESSDGDSDFESEWVKYENTDHLNNIKANFFFEELSSDDEIFTFQCPKNFNVTSLLNQSLSMDKVSKFKDADNKFKCQILPGDRESLTCVFPSKKKGAAVVRIPLAGHISITERVSVPQNKLVIEEVQKESEDVKFEGPVRRHPLLGKNWDNHLRTIRKQIKRQKKMLKKSMEHKKSLVKAEKEKKEQKKILKAQLSLLKKTLGTEAL